MPASDILTPTYRQMLTLLSAWLDKAATQLGAGRADSLLSARLAEDMFPLATQVRFACAQALEGAFRLKEQAFPDLHQALLDEGRNAAEQPGSLAAAKVRIAQTLAALDGITSETSDLAPETAIAHELPNGMIFDLTVEQHVRDWALPQFYFHLMTAYAILRNAGVGLGKADYVAHMFAYLRAGTAPGG